MGTVQESDRKSWVAWLKHYGARNLFDSIVVNCQGAKSTCRYCGENIYFDIIEGGGVPAWGTGDEYRHEGLDYGCQDSPDTTEEGTGSHMPVTR